MALRDTWPTGAAPSSTPLPGRLWAPRPSGRASRVLGGTASPVLPPDITGDRGSTWEVQGTAWGGRRAQSPSPALKNGQKGHPCSLLPERPFHYPSQQHEAVIPPEHCHENQSGSVAGIGRDWRYGAATRPILPACRARPSVRHAGDLDYRVVVVRHCCADPDAEVDAMLLDIVIASGRRSSPRRSSLASFLEGRRERTRPIDLEKRRHSVTNPLLRRFNPRAPRLIHKAGMPVTCRGRTFAAFRHEADRPRRENYLN